MGVNRGLPSPLAPPGVRGKPPPFLLLRAHLQTDDLCLLRARLAGNAFFVDPYDPQGRASRVRCAYQAGTHSVPYNHDSLKTSKVPIRCLHVILERSEESHVAGVLTPQAAATTKHGFVERRRKHGLRTPKGCRHGADPPVYIALVGFGTSSPVVIPAKRESGRSRTFSTACQPKTPVKGDRATPRNYPVGVA